MKKKILAGIVLCAIAVLAAWNVELGIKSYDWSTVSLANVEALAQESSSTIDCCWTPQNSVCIIVVPVVSGELAEIHLINYFNAKPPCPV
jgi:hypothetical protein